MKCLLALVVFLLSHSPPTYAVITNGGFETGDFTGWQTVGDTAVVNAAFGTPPAAGTYQALITSGLPSFSGTPDVFLGFEAFFGLAPNSLVNFASALGAFPSINGGSGMKQSFSGNAGEVLLFQWNYLTGDNGSGCCDFSFVVVDGSISLLGYFGSAFSPSSTIRPSETGYHLFASTLITSGNHTIGLGSVQTLDFFNSSAILIDSVCEIPEPSSWLLFLIGLVLCLGAVGLGARLQSNPISDKPPASCLTPSSSTLTFLSPMFWPSSS